MTSTLPALPAKPAKPAGPPLGMETPPWLRIDLPKPLTWALVLAAVGVGVVGDLAIRSGFAGVAGALLVLAASAVLLASERLRTRQSKVLVALAPLFGTWLALRDSLWLLPLDVVATLGLLALGVSLSSGGSALNLPLASLISRGWHATLHAMVVPESIVRLIAARKRNRPGAAVTWAVVRGMLIAVPVVLLLGVLLMSADAVFKNLVSFDVELDTAFTEHLFVIFFLGWGFLALLRVASAAAPAQLSGPSGRLGAVEAFVVLGAVVVLFGGFAIAQLIAVIGGADYVRETTGLTYAEYARSGFFQLLWVAALTVGGLLVLRTATNRTEPRRARAFAVLASVVCVLTMLIVAVAIRRLALYSDVFGLSMLRLYSTIFAVWIGVVLLLVIAWLAGVRADRTWLPGVAAATGLALLLGLNIANPEAIVASTNLQRDASQEIDTDYLTTELSDDAVPTIARLLPSLEPDIQSSLTSGLCQPRDSHTYHGWAAWNVSRDRAADHRAEVCRP
jgi:two-component system sensor histidine kinase BaeS